VDAIGTSEVFELAENGDTTARAVIDEALVYLAIAFANVANLLAPELIVLGGGLGLAKADVIIPRVSSHLRQLARPVIAPRIQLVKACSGPDAGLIGAARLMMGG
jgi:glucokinase